MKNHTIVFRDRSGSMQGLVDEADAIADLFLHYPGTVELWDGVDKRTLYHGVKDNHAWGPWPAKEFEDATTRIERSPAVKRRFVLITDEPTTGMPPSARQVLQRLRIQHVQIIVMEVRP